MEHTPDRKTLTPITNTRTDTRTDQDKHKWTGTNIRVNQESNGPEWTMKLGCVAGTCQEERLDFCKCGVVWWIFNFNFKWSKSQKSYKSWINKTDGSSIKTISVTKCGTCNITMVHYRQFLVHYVVHSGVHSSFCSSPFWCLFCFVSVSFTRTLFCSSSLILFFVNTRRVVKN